ncbi:MAG: hypothetical protein SGBAC_012330 [Bacillariaceae sp.]
MTYKDNIVEAIGGQSQFDFAVIKYCENIQDDRSVSIFFADMDLNGLIDMQKEFLNAAFLDLSTQESEAAMGRLTVKYQHLWQNGLNESSFSVLKAHFIEALRDCWVEERNVALLDQHYDSLKPLFQQQNDKVLDKEVQDVPVDRIQISSVAQRSVIRSRLGGVNGHQRT